MHMSTTKQAFPTRRIKVRWEGSPLPQFIQVGHLVSQIYSESGEILQIYVKDSGTQQEHVIKCSQHAEFAVEATEQQYVSRRGKLDQMQQLQRTACIDVKSMSCKNPESTSHTEVTSS